MANAMGITISQMALAAVARAITNNAYPDCPVQPHLALPCLPPLGCCATTHRIPTLCTCPAVASRSRRWEMGASRADLSGTATAKGVSRLCGTRVYEIPSLGYFAGDVCGPAGGGDGPI